MSWEKYLKTLGLTDKIITTEEDLKREADAALSKVNKWVEQARKKKDSGA